MLIGKSPLISSALLAILHRMGHRDEIVQVYGQRVLRAGGRMGRDLLDAMRPLWTHTSQAR